MNWNSYLNDNEHIFDKIKQWGVDRGIIQNSSPLAQTTKTLEEVQEMFDAIVRDDKYDLGDAIGDVVVTLIMVAGTANLDFKMCIEQAYEEIKDRKGYLRPDGTFVKEVGNE
jgi:NTP pyrophosphatase (non-canonical NTP hydrolase)